MKHRLSPMAGVWLGVLMAGAQPSSAAEVKVLTAGAFKQVVLAVVPEFEKQTGHKVVVDNDTVGGLTKKIEGGEQFDVVVLTPAAIDSLTSKGKISDGSKSVLARVGVGVMVKAGAPVPDIGSVEAFKRALISAKTVAYIDPASGGSSGIYIAGLLDRLGIADQIKPKAKLKQGGYVADLDQERRGGARHPPDQRDRAGQGSDAGRPAAGGDPELHHLRGGRQRRNEGERSRQGPDQGVLRPGRGRRAQGKGHGSAGSVRLPDYSSATAALTTGFNSAAPR